jgi:glyoxylase-like metal-dependent hydrolase (beta-lactamase superfamily II)
MGMVAMPRIDVLELSRILAVPDFHPDHGNPEPIPVYGFAIHHSDGIIVVDTGIGLDNAFIDKLYRHESVGLVDELHRHGIDERDVALIVNSHLHFDHCGQNHPRRSDMCAGGRGRSRRGAVLYRARLGRDPASS